KMRASPAWVITTGWARPETKGSSVASVSAGGCGGGGSGSPFTTLTASCAVPMPSPSRLSWPLVELPAAYRVTGPLYPGACQRNTKLAEPCAKALGSTCEISLPTTCTSGPTAWKVPARPATPAAETPRPAVTPGPPDTVTVNSAMVPASSCWGPLMVTVGTGAPGAWQAAQVAPPLVPGLPEKPSRPKRLASAWLLHAARRTRTAHARPHDFPMDLSHSPDRPSIAASGARRQ